MSELNEQQELEKEQPTDALEEAAPDTEEAPAEPAPKAEDDVETLKKRLADTQAWAHERNQRALELERQHNARQAEALKSEVHPDVLDNVRKATQVLQIEDQQKQKKREQEAYAAIEDAVPEALELRSNPAFAEALNQEADKLMKAGKDLLNPAIAVRAVLAAKVQFEQSQQRQAAEKAEAERKTSKLASMKVPGSGSGAQPGQSSVPDAEAIWKMAPSDFEKMKQKVRGF